jgi:surfeit locus 1 family protein
MRTAGLVNLTIATLLGLALLIGLGVWQLQRLQWKEALIAQVAARTERKPMPLDNAIALAKKDHDLTYTPVIAEGRYHHTLERYLYAMSPEGEPGWHVITPLETVKGTMLLVDRGFVPDALRDPATRKQGEVSNVVTVTGLVRPSEQPNIFVPDNEPKKNQWFSRDLQAMSRSMFPGGTVQVAPFFLEAKAGEVPGGWPKGGQTRLTFPNNHLQYAITWFGLAVCLMVIYGVFVWGAYRGKGS